MLEQVNNAVAFYAFFTESKMGKTGLTVTVDVWLVNTSGTATEVVTGGSATEVGDGLYRYGLASGSVTVEGEYLSVFKTATTSVDSQHIPALWVVNKAGVENLDAAVGNIPTVAEIWTTALTEAYRATGSAGTPAQLLFELLQNLTQFSLSGTTKTVKKLDGSTTAKTYALNSATAPTSIAELT